MKNILSQTVGATRALGVATFLASSAAQSDEALLPPGTVLGEFPASSIPTLQNTFATQLISDITPDPALMPSTSFRWLLVKTENGLSLTLPENHNGAMQHFGQQEKFFIRFDLETGMPQISFDLQNWQPYTAGTPVNISREEQTTILDISTNLQLVSTLQAQKEDLTATLADQEQQLAQVQEDLDILQAQYSLSSDDLTIVQTDLASQSSTKNTLETAITPEAKLREDVHPITQNTTLDDTTKTTLTQTTLNTYDAYEGGPEGPGTPLMTAPQFAPQVSSTSTFTLPTSAEVQATLTLLTQELTRIQAQITTVNSQITAKQNETNTTQNSINSTQQSLDQLTAQLTQYMNDYIYWRDEYNRLVALTESTSAEMASIKSGYVSDRNRLISTGSRSDVPSNLDSSTITTEINTLKSQIFSEYNAIAVATNTLGTTDTITKNLNDATSITTTRLDSSYYFITDFASLTRSYPAIIKMYLKPVGSSSFALSSTTFTAYNPTHLAALVSKTAKPKMDKLCDYTFADKVLETKKENYLVKKADYNTYVSGAATAFGKRQTAQTNINTAQPLVDQRQAELNTLNTQKTTLTTQKTELESLKNTKAQLQTLYNRVKTIIDQLQLHISSHSAITQQVADLLNQTQAIQDEIANLEIIISTVEGDEADLVNLIASTSDTLTTINTSLTQNEQQLLAILNTLSTIIPQDSFSRDGTILKPASEAVKYFGDGYRTGYFSGMLSGLPAKWITQYECTQGVNDIYPAYGSVQYIINGRAYRTDAQKMNNFTHKELVNGYNTDAVTKLNACIALLNQYPAGSEVGIENFLATLKTQIAGLQSSQSTNATIRNHVTATNSFTKKTLFQGGSYALFENLVANNPAFSLKIEEMTEIGAQKGNIGDATDARNDLRHMITTILAQVFAERLMTTGTESLDLYVHWEQESLSFINGIGDISGKVDINADWSIDAHGNKYKFGLYHPAGLGSYTLPATLFMMYSPDGSNTQVLGPVQVKSGSEAESMKARWKEELLKMKRSHVDNYSGGSYDTFRGTDETGENVYWGKYVFGGRLYETGFQSGDEITVGNYIQTLLKQKLLASQRASSYENQYDEIWAGYEYTTALYAQSIPNYPYAQKAPNIVLHNALETLLYNRIVVLESQYPSLSSLDARSDNLVERSQLYQSISRPHYERLRTLPDGVEKDAEVAKARLIGHELTKNAILQCQISAENELGIEKINDIKAGIEFGVSFVPIAGTVVSFVLLFDESKSLDEKAWELAGLIPIPGAKNLKYVGKIDEVVELVDDVAGGVNKIMMKRPVQSMTKSVYLYGLKDINAARNALKANAKNWGPEVIDAIKANDPIRGGQIDTIFNAGQLLHTKLAKDGRTVFISEDRFIHLTQEIRPGDTSTRYEQLVDIGIIKYGDSVTGLIDNVVKTADNITPNPGGGLIYWKLINNQNIQVKTGTNGIITTITP